MKENVKSEKRKNQHKKLEGLFFPTEFLSFLHRRWFSVWEHGRKETGQLAIGGVAQTSVRR